MAGEAKGGLLGWLDGPRLVVSAFSFFLLGLTFLGVLLWTDQQKQVDRIDALVAEQNSESIASKTSQVNTCFQRASQGPAFQEALYALERESTDLRVQQTLADLRVLNNLSIPTFQECRQLANQLNVPLPKGIR